MIRIFQGRDRNQFPREADEMFRLRTRQFGERLKWDVDIRDGWEIDQFDEMNPLYLVSIDEQSNAVAGCLRYLPTSGPTMLRNVFDRYFDEAFDIESPLIWECTRFAIEPAIARDRVTTTGMCQTTYELMQGGTEVALMAGVQQVVGIFDAFMLRVYRRINYGPEIVASSDRVGPNTIYVGIWDISEAKLAALRERSGIVASVLEDAAVPVRAVA